MLIVTPAVAGPFDLGSVAVRAALNVDPETAKVTVVSDPIPTILQGIPLDVRSIAVKIDRPDFTLNPTSCEVKSLTAEAISVTGNVAESQQPLPGRRLLQPRLQAKPGPKAQRRDQTRRSPSLDRNADLPQRRRLLQHRQSPGSPAALGVPRHHPHQDDLHPRAVRRFRLPQGGDLRLRESDNPAARQAPGRPGLPALLQPPAARRRR